MDESLINVNFPKLNHFWMDSGLLGLYIIAKQNETEDIEVIIREDGVTFRGAENKLDSFIHEVYNSLLSQYYNTSTDKQKNENTGFYYDSVADEFVRFPKIKAMGIAGLIFDKPPRPTASQIKYTKDKKLPENYAHLQEKFDKFLEEEHLKIESSNLLVDGRNSIQPNVKISVHEKKQKGTCFLCGNKSHTLKEITGTVYPMISGSSGTLSFNSTAGKPEKICWKCDFIGKFVPVNGFYVFNDGNCHMYFPYSASLVKMYEVFGDLRAIKIEDPYLFKNFDMNLGGYFQKTYELLFSFLFSLYELVLSKKDSGLDYGKLFDIHLSNSPLEYFVIHTQEFSKTQVGKMVWPFKDSVYFFRLLDDLRDNEIDIKKVMGLLVDFDQKKNENKTIYRNKVCERILKKQSVLELIEKHVFKVNKSKFQYIKPLNDFVIIYEKVTMENGCQMNQDLIDTAVSLGKTIGKSIGPSGRKGKGDLFRLRKSRKPEDFLSEINRIQMKYGASVTSELYKKGQEFEANFTEFKHFCMIAALNTYNVENKTVTNETVKTEIKE